MKVNTKPTCQSAAQKACRLKWQITFHDHWDIVRNGTPQDSRRAQGQQKPGVQRGLKYSQLSAGGQAVGAAVRWSQPVRRGSCFWAARGRLLCNPSASKRRHPHGHESALCSRGPGWKVESTNEDLNVKRREKERMSTPFAARWSWRFPELAASKTTSILGKVSGRLSKRWFTSHGPLPEARFWEVESRGCHVGCVPHGRGSRPPA